MGKINFVTDILVKNLEITGEVLKNKEFAKLLTKLKKEKKLKISNNTIKIMEDGYILKQIENYF